MARLGMYGWFFVLGLSLVNYGLRYLRWDIYLRRLGHAIPQRLNLAYYLGGFAFTTTPGKAGEAVRSLYLKRHGVRYTASLAALFTERLVDLVAMLLLAMSGALAFEAYRPAILLLATLTLAVILFIHAPPGHNLIERMLKYLPGRKLRHFGHRLLDLVRMAAELLRAGSFFAGLVLALLAWGAEAIGFYIILSALGLETTIAIAVGIYSASVLVGALSFIPGGLGSTEAVMVLLLKLIGADTPTAIAATVICRLATLWFAVMIGLIAFAASEARSRNFRHEAADDPNW